MNKRLLLVMTVFMPLVGCSDNENGAREAPRTAKATTPEPAPETRPVTPAPTPPKHREPIPASAPNPGQEEAETFVASSDDSESADDATEIRPTVYVAESILDQYVGYYEVPPGAILHVTREDEQLFVQAMGSEEFPVYAESSTTFFYRVYDAQITFNRGADGSVESLTLHQPSRDQVGKRLPRNYKPPELPEEVEIDTGLFELYAGTYELEAGGKIYVTAEEDKLMVSLPPNRPPFQVFPKSDTEFFFKVYDMHVVFVKDTAGKVTGLRVQRGNLYQAAKKIE